MMNHLLLSALLLLSVLNSIHAQPAASIEDVYPVFISNKLAATKAFYTQQLGLQVSFESSIFLILTTQNPSRTVAFMPEDHPFVKPRLKLYQGAGAYLTLQVADAAKLHQELRNKQLPIIYPLTKEDWGQLRFALMDPNGIWIDVVQNIDPIPGYYDKYPLK